MNIISRIKKVFPGLVLISFFWVIPSTLLCLPDYSYIEDFLQLESLYLGFMVFFMVIISNMMARYFIFESSAIRKDFQLRGTLLILAIIIRLILFEVESMGSFIGITAGILGTADLIIFSCLLGSYLPEAIKRVPELIPVCSVAFFIDLFSVFQGPSKKIANLVKEHYVGGIKEEIPFIDMFLVKIPNPSVDYLTPIFGVSDLIFVIFISAVMLKFKIDDNMTGKSIGAIVMSKGNNFFYFPLVIFSLMAAIFMASWLNIFLPALPVIVMVTLPWVIINNSALFKLKKSDWILTFVPPVAILVLYLLF